MTPEYQFQMTRVGDTVYIKPPDFYYNSHYDSHVRQAEELAAKIPNDAKRIVFPNMLFGNQLQGSAARAFASAFSKHPNVQHISIIGHEIGDTGAIAFAECIKTNSSIRVLDLSDNRIGTEGYTALAHALAHPNCHLKRLVLSSNVFDRNGGLEAIATIGLSRNKSLDHLQIQWKDYAYQPQDLRHIILQRQEELVPIRDAYVKALKHHNHTLKTLVLSYDAVSKKVQEELSKTKETQALLWKQEQQQNSCIGIHLFFNRLGRRSFRDFTPGIWPDVLASSTEQGREVRGRNTTADTPNRRIVDLNVLYHAIKGRPDLTSAGSKMMKYKRYHNHKQIHCRRAP